MNIAIIIPAYNEEKRIAPTLESYHDYLSNMLKKHEINGFELIVVQNGCTDNTDLIVNQLKLTLPFLSSLETKRAGKGIALKEGFSYALKKDFQLIGFVDADMATQPRYFHELITELHKYNVQGTIASRYIKGAIIEPKRPRYKRWGSKFIYEPLVKLFTGLHYHDLQCGAKLFKKDALEAVVDKLSIEQWAIDMELLFLLKQHSFQVKEVPTTWFDQDHSKLEKPFRQGMKMLKAAWQVRKHKKKGP